MDQSDALPIIDGYAIEKRLGKGGMASVYLARHNALDRIVALKLMDVTVSADAAALARFEREARLVAKLQHRHIVSIYDIGRSQSGQVYFTMPLLSGGDLRQRIGQLSASQTQQVLQFLLAALAFAHEHGVVHRDVKPENLLFDADGLVMLADFGVAYTDQRDGRVTADGLTVGSANYMSPEQARGVIVDARADLYSVGIIAFEMLTGKVPYQGAHWLDTLMAHQHQPVPRLPGTLSAWQSWIDRALAKVPEQRFQSAAQMLQHLPNAGQSVDQKTERDRVAVPLSGDRFRVTSAASEALPAPSKRMPAWTWLALSTLILVGLGFWWSKPNTSGVSVDQAKATPAQVITVADVRALIANKQWFVEGAQLDAWRALAQLPVADSEKLAFKQSFLDSLALEIQAQLQTQNWQQLSLRVPQFQKARDAWKLDRSIIDSKAAVAVEEGSARLIGNNFSDAINRFEQAGSEPAQQLLSVISPQPAALTKQLNIVKRLPQSRLRYVPSDGLTYSLLKAPTATQVGVAAVRVGNDRLRALKFTDAANCRKSCVNYLEAVQIANRLNLNLPNVADIQRIKPALAHLDLAGGRLLTKECKMEYRSKRQNVAQRSVGAIRRWIGKPVDPPTVAVCVGYVAVDPQTGTSIVLGERQRQDDVQLVLLASVQMPK